MITRRERTGEEEEYLEYIAAHGLPGPGEEIRGGG